MGALPGGPAMSPAVLVVDDDPSIRELLLDLFEAEGYRVVTAADGDTALALAVAEPPRLVLTDLWMPGLNGQALATRLGEHGLSLLPVLFMSGMSRPASLPPERFLAKP